MDTTYAASMGEGGRLVVPAELRSRQHWQQGTSLLFIETPEGVVVATREQATRIVREQLSGKSLVDELVEERRAASRTEDAA
ncbi:hypothetical protein SAMN04489806_3095 [Paramicrobacterium humi]|uniref:Looped-hinge helix DNA binding domain-containing protein, AbrB family n=1 Tax=Paramicrobacterium humi TaxID=640635 RepID=A0A1H4T3V5_9MICO|nr:AbrB/MazE/SpoVT family DNA-binding domain-containing protein [Microbacterium humi]SEC51097.1 hypothetical protein SAMN04489806_3095 [Microbacterium humi]